MQDNSTSREPRQHADTMMPPFTAGVRRLSAPTRGEPAPSARCRAAPCALPLVLGLIGTPAWAQAAGDTPNQVNAVQGERLLVPLAGGVWIQDGLDGELRCLVPAGEQPALDAQPLVQPHVAEHLQHPPLVR